MQHNIATYRLEFIGGPYDGYCQEVAIPYEKLMDCVVLPINSNVIRVVQGEAPGEPTVTQSVAIYELNAVADERQYRFVAAHPGSSQEWDTWCNKVCAAWKRLSA